MSDALIGVIVGSLSASLVPIIKMFLDYRKWRIGQKQALLQDERERLAKDFEIFLPKIASEMSQVKFSTDLISRIDISFPKEISERFWEWFEDKDKSTIKGKIAYLEICKLAHQKISELDRQIRKL